VADFAYKSQFLVYLECSGIEIDRLLQRPVIPEQ
jgi:hypothetical protein